ncbi:hypothetical protein [Pseudomonas mangrovi]|nr:hypothetical protein [Pseudomonas mangrovi]
MCEKPEPEVEEPYLIDPGSEDPGSSIEQIAPPPEPLPDKRKEPSR